MTLAAVPLPWRKVTPLHRQFGARSKRFPYPAGMTLPVAATPQNLRFPYSNVHSLDRIVGLTLSFAYSQNSITLVIEENNTGWRLDYAFGGFKGAFMQLNMETLPEEANITFWFSASTFDAPIYLSFMNIELVPFQML